LKGEQDELLTSAQVAKLFAVSIKTVSRWAGLGLLPVIRTPGGQLRFRRSDVEEFLRRQQNEP
jgi:excisionase family DNA binding protein